MKKPPSMYLPTTFYVGDRVLTQLEATIPPMPKGTGIIWEDGNRYRVVDTWASFDHHGQLDIGYHVWLEPLGDNDEDRPYNQAPDYFTPS